MVKNKPAKKTNKSDKTNGELDLIRQQLVHAGKMATLGQITAGITHELKQPLTGIIGFIEDVLEDVEEDSPIANTLKTIQKESDRMWKLLDNIRKFSRMAETKREPVNVNTVINETLTLLEKQLVNNNITLDLLLDETVPEVSANFSQMQQVFSNMIANAKDAMEADGGTLVLKSALSENGKAVEVSFKDTGCGMPKEVIDKLAEPFFTTKGRDKGTGLGTSISFSIVKEHNGKVDVKSKVGEGTLITVTFPVSE